MTPAPPDALAGVAALLALLILAAVVLLARWWIRLDRERAEIADRAEAIRRDADARRREMRSALRPPGKRFRP